MKEIKFLVSLDELQTEFRRCCKDYTHLEMYVAWVGNPKNIIPYIYLESLQVVKVFVGIAFDQSSPDGIQHLIDSKCKVVIVNTKETYHQKLYFFSSKEKVALIMGSSNFTYSGFSENVEGNILIEGSEHNKTIQNYLSEIRKSTGKLESFNPSNQWLKEYRQRYINRIKIFKKAKTKDQAIWEDNLAAASSWLGKANWEVYMKQIMKADVEHSKVHKESLPRLLEYLKEYAQHLKSPWTPSFFDAIENRRRILGNSGYGWLGHVGASGRIRQLLASGSAGEKRTICNSINKIAALEMPINYGVLKTELNKLSALGPTIKVWGRLLAITRPDIYCTISSHYVRSSLSKLLKKPSSYFQTTEGYID